MTWIVGIIATIIMGVVPAAMAEEPINIGALLPMTGSVAAFGQMAWDGINTARKIEPEALGRPIDIKLSDTKSEKVDSANAVSRLIEKEKVVVVIGELISGNTIAASDYAERTKIPMVSPTATNPLVTQGKQFVFRVCFVDPEQGRVAAKLALDELHAKTAAIIYDISQDYCVGLKTFFQREFTQGGGKILGEVMYKMGDRDFTPQLSRIKSLKPDIIYAPIYYTECALIAKQAREMGLNAPILAGDGVQAPELIQLGGKAVEGIYFTAHFHTDTISTPMGKKFFELFKKEVGKELDSYTAQSADAYFVVVDAIKRAGSTDPVKIRDALSATKDFEGLTGKITIKPDGNAIKPMVVNKVKDGKFVYVTTIMP